jgi:DNA-binding NarL/FixJ family response regulator
MTSGSRPNSRPLALFLADDHSIVRDGLRVLLERTGRFRIVGEAADGRALVTRALELQPDAVLTDLAMTELNGIEATRQLRQQGFTGLILMLSARDERHLIAQALAAGVNAYVHKDHAFEQVLAALEAAGRGEVWLSPQLAALLEDAAVPLLTQLLSSREREVLQLLAEGKNAKEIAGELHLSPKTVEIHRLNLYAKLKVNNLADLTRIAVKEGLASL